jgi:3-oxoisoapionate kinase
LGDLLISFVGDDFTGSTDAMETLALAGVRTVLFTAPPTAGQIARYPGLRAFGVATTARAQSPEEMGRTLRPIFRRLREIAPSIVHYKVCSTFDSSPTVGSIGRAIEVGAEVFGTPCVPVVVGAPSLGRYTAFGQLFARGGDGLIFRIDRHPMSRHPVTPMNEADLSVHLAKQTNKTIGLLDVRTFVRPREAVIRDLDAAALGREILFLDLLYESHLPTVGMALEHLRAPSRPLFVVGSSGVESALCALWRGNGALEAATFAPTTPVRPILVACGSCSPVTAAQIRRATESGFGELLVGAPASVVSAAVDFLRDGRSVVLHTGGGDATRRASGSDTALLGSQLGRVVRAVLERQPLRRMIVAGGDTSGAVAAALGIESMEMIAPLVRGAPLCRLAAPGSPADGMEVVFKGGQIGPESFFVDVAQGSRG